MIYQLRFRNQLIGNVFCFLSIDYFSVDSGSGKTTTDDTLQSTIQGKIELDCLQHS